MGAFDEKVVVRRAEHGRKGVRVCKLPLRGVVRGAQTIRRAPLERRQRFKEAVVMNTVERRDHAAVWRNRLHARRAGNECAYHKAGRRLMQAEQSEGIAMARAKNRIDVFRRSAPVGLCHLTILKAHSFRHCEERSDEAIQI